WRPLSSSWWPTLFSGPKGVVGTLAPPPGQLYRRMTTTDTASRAAPPRQAPARARRPPPSAPRPRRSWFWRYRRVLFLFGLLGATAIGGVAYVIAQVPLPRETPLAQTTIL